MVLSANFALTEFSEGCLQAFWEVRWKATTLVPWSCIYRPHPWEYAAIVTW